MKIIPLTTFVVGKPPRSVPPLEPVDIEDDEAKSLIARGLATLPPKRAAADSDEDKQAGGKK